MAQDDSVSYLKTVDDPFFMESVEGGTNLDNLRYRGRGERRYGVGRQLLVRSCHDALVECPVEGGGRGILLVRRQAEPANGYLWSLGGFYDRGVPGEASLASRIEGESGLKIDPDSYTVLGHVRALWNTTPYKNTDTPEAARDFMSSVDLSVPYGEIIELARQEGGQVYEYISGVSFRELVDLVQEQNLPRGIDDTGLLLYANSTGGKLNLDKLHDNARVVTPDLYYRNEELRESLHPYILEGMKRAIPLVEA